MLFDSVMLARISADLQRSAVGSGLGRVFLNARQEVALELRRKLPRPQLLISWSVQFGRMQFTDTAEPQPDLTLPFGDVLRKYLRGATLIGCRQIKFDRLVHLQFANCRGMGPQSRATLIAEIMGRHSNLILLDEDDTILACARSVPAHINRYRQILPGRDYVPPPTFERIAPHQLSPHDLFDAAKPHLDMRFGKFIRNTVIGGSDIFLDEVAARADLDGDAKLRELHDRWHERAHSAIQDIVSEAETAGPGYVYYPHDSDDGQAFAYPLSLDSRPRYRTETVDDLSAALDRVAAHQKRHHLMQQRRQHLKTAAEKALKKASARVSERKEVLSEAEDPDKWRRRGDLVLANLHAISPGASEVTVTDYHDTEQPEITIDLDPNLSPQQNAEAMFDRYKRAQRIRKRVPRLLRVAQIRREYLEGVLQQIQTADDPDELAQLQQELIDQDIISQQKKDRRRRPDIGKVEPRRATSNDGYPLLYGKTGMENDAVVRAANADDIWCHVKQGPGGHVVIRTNDEPDDVPPTTIEQAAALAAYLSKWRSDSRAEVNYTLAKHVNKPRGGPPGFVTYTDFDTVVVQPAPID